MRLRARVDRNQKEVVDVFRSFGLSWLPLHQVGKGCPDGVVANDDQNILVEIKDGKTDLTDDQIEFHDRWRGPLLIIRDVEEAIELAKLLADA